MNWKEIKSIEQLEEIIAASKDKTQVIFKHSTRCFISKMVKRKFEHDWNSDDTPYLLDLINHRDVSNSIAEKLNLEHQSPQVIVISKGKVIHHNSHSEINAKTIGELLVSA